ncbi:hypothetical protein CQW23_12211 [Capsicum baccatum]|uniref:Uncharacterized protein n=1 Tax=Capsicum baccatum TaxID=33114 RepID=A0A2G2WRY7_CAPBA|nr:hypothetical protein CQW23_12211 [Capsicum baccatum]
MADAESAPSPSPLSIQVKDYIDLSPEGEELFKLHRKVAKHFNLGIELRVAGGWQENEDRGSFEYTRIDDVAVVGINNRDFD